MILYKFRPLANLEDLCRAKEILQTGKFWCSKFSELNDPMEGAFHANTIDEINSIYSDKERYKICSFSNHAAFDNPIMWGYYANGFKGIVIELEVGKENVEKVEYVDEIYSLENLNEGNKAKKILTTKLTSWEHESEYRFLKQTVRKKNKIGEIAGVYLGNPYGYAKNKTKIYETNDCLSDYLGARSLLINFTKNLGLSCKFVRLERGKVEVEDSIT